MPVQRMLTLILTAGGVVLVSALCSMMEAALYSVPVTHIETLRAAGSGSGRILAELRSDVSRPIAAVLTLMLCASPAAVETEYSLPVDLVPGYEPNPDCFTENFNNYGC